MRRSLDSPTTVTTAARASKKETEPSARSEAKRLRHRRLPPSCKPVPGPRTPNVRSRLYTPRSRGGSASQGLSLEYTRECKFSQLRSSLHASLPLITRSNLTKAAPAPGGALRVDSEVEGLKLWDNYFNKGKIDVVMPR